MSSTIIQPTLFHQVKIISYSFNSLPLASTRYSPSPLVSIRHTTLPFFRYNPFPISFRTPVLANPDKVPAHKAGKTVPVRNGINPSNAGKNPPSTFMLWDNCVLTFLLSCLSFLHMLPLVCQLVIWLM